MSKPLSPKRPRCELCNRLVSANAYTPCCGKRLCAACAQADGLSGVAGTRCPICQTPYAGLARQAAASSPTPADWLAEDYELRVSGCDE